MVFLLFDFSKYFFFGEQFKVDALRERQGFRSVFQRIINRDGAGAPGICSVHVGLRPAVCGQQDVRVLHDVVLLVHDRSLAANKKKRVAVVQHTHFIRGHKLASDELPVGGAAPVPATGAGKGFGVDGLLTQQLGDVFVGAQLIAAQVEKFVAVAHKILPLLFKECLELCHVLDDDGYGDLTGSHRRHVL